MATTKTPHLLLHNLIGAISYWGTTTRMMLIGFVFGVAILLHIVDASTDVSNIDYAQAYVYVMACLLLLDAGYVTIARAKPFDPKSFDKAVLWLILVVLAVIVVVPYFVAVEALLFRDITKWLFVGVLFVLALRLVLGMLQPGKK